MVVALAGGVLVWLSAVLLMLANGRIAGISGIVGGLFGGGSGEISWRLAFLVGLIAGPFAAMLCGAPLPHDPDRCPRSGDTRSRLAGRLRFAAGQRVYQRPRGLGPTC